MAHRVTKSQTRLKWLSTHIDSCVTNSTIDTQSFRMMNQIITPQMILRLLCIPFLSPVPTSPGNQWEILHHYNVVCIFEMLCEWNQAGYTLFPPYFFHPMLLFWKSFMSLSNTYWYMFMHWVYSGKTKLTDIIYVHI